MRTTCRIPVLAVLAASIAFGCSHKATVVRDDGRAVDGVVVGGDTHHLHVVPGEWSSEPLRIPRDAIRHIDHPGDGAFWTGVGVGVVGGMSVLTALSTLDHRDDDTEVIVTAGVALLVYGVVSGGLITWGRRVGTTSRAAAQAPGTASAVAPFIGPQGIGVRF